MADWLDGWARRAARSADQVDSAGSAPRDGLSRRQLLKRAGVAVGAAWTVPLIQTALAPPAAASGGGSGVIGSSCTTDSQCASGLVCQGSFCTQTGMSWTGGGCNVNTDCWSNVCVGGVCKPGPLSASCRTSADCANNISCAASQICGDSGASCTNSNKCMTGTCLASGVCA